MTQVLRLNHTDERITYFPDWETIPNSGVGQNGSYSLTTLIGAEFFLLFRGTSIRLYGRLGGGGGNLLFRLDVNNTNVALNGTNFEGGPTLVWSAGNLGDGDHQLYVLVNSLQQNGSVAVDYVEIPAFRIENSSGNGFDLLWAGPNATNVPKEAIIVDNSSPGIGPRVASMWESSIGGQYYRRSLVSTNQAGASLEFYFWGEAIWYYGDTNQSHGFFTISIDGEEPERLDSKNDRGHLAQQMLWSKTSLTPDLHVFTLRHDDLGGRWINLDFFRVLEIGAVKTSLQPTPTDIPPMSTIPSESKSDVVPLAVGLTLGILTLVIGAFYLLRRRRRKAAQLDACATPPHHTPPAHGNHLPVALQESKRPPQSTQPPTYGLAPSSFALTTSANPSMSIDFSSWGMPSGYETYDHDESGPDL